MFCSFMAKVVLLKIKLRFYLLVPNIEPPFPVQPLTVVQVIGSTCSEKTQLMKMFYSKYSNKDDSGIIDKKHVRFTLSRDKSCLVVCII